MTDPRAESIFVVVLVPCGRGTIWNTKPDRGSIAAADAYTGTPFRINRLYAERFGDAWIVLSVKYGFIPPEFTLPEPYEVSVKHPGSRPVSMERLRE